MTLKRSHWLLLILLGALLARILFSIYFRFNMTGDAADYLRIANNLWEHGYFGAHAVPDNSRPHAYPFLISILAFITEHKLTPWQWTGFNYVCDALSIFLFFRIGLRSTGAASYFGIALVAFSPIWIAHVNSAVTEPISVTLYLLFLERWTAPGRSNRDLMICGLVMSLLITTRSMFLLFPGVIVLVDWFLRLGKHRKVTLSKWVWLHSGFLMYSYLLPILWGVRNAITLKDFTITQPETAKLMLWLGTKIPDMDFRIPEMARRYFQEPAIIQYTAAQTLSERAAVLDKMQQEALQIILNHPLQYLEGLWIKFARLWVNGLYNPYSYGLTPYYGSNLYLTCFVLPVLILGLVGLASVLFKRGRWSEEKRQASLQLLLCFYITGVTVPMSVDGRYSLIPWLCFGLWFIPGLRLLFTPFLKPFRSREKIRKHR